MKFMPLVLFVVFIAFPFNEAHTDTSTIPTTIPTTIGTTSFDRIRTGTSGGFQHHRRHGNISGRKDINYVVYMPDKYNRGKDFYIYIIINHVKSPVHIRNNTIVTIYVNGRQAGKLQVLYEKSSTIAISSYRFTRQWRNEVRVTARQWRGSTLFSDVRRISKRYVVQYRGRSYDIFIQKDKPFYKPNDMVRFKCFGLDSHLMVLKPLMNIQIIDPIGNLMKNWVNVISKTGVVSKEFLLSDKPVLGNWRIRCSLNLTKPLVKTELFPVEEYVLPPIKVTLSTDKYICHLGFPAFFLAKRYIDIVVNARYSFGVPVKGRAILRITINNFKKMSFQKVFPINGKLVYRFYLKYFFGVTKYIKIFRYAGMPSYISLTVFAKVIEDETHLDITSNSVLVSLTKAPVEISSRYSIYKKPGLNTQFQIVIKRVDGKPLTWDDVKKQLQVIFVGEDKFEMLYFIPLDGVVTIQLPDKKYKSIRICYAGFYQDTEYRLYRNVYIYTFTSPSRNYLQVSLKKTNCFAGDSLNVLIRSTTKLIQCYCLVIKDDKFINSGHFYVFGSETTMFIRTTKYWIPYVRIVFTCFTINNKILVDVLPIKLCNDFKYKISGMYSPAKNRAGQRTMLNMASARGSTLYIMAVDERLEFLKKPNYISKDSIMKSFNRRYQTSIPPYISNVRSLLEWCQLTWISNQIDHYDIHRRIAFTSGPMQPVRPVLNKPISPPPPPSTIKVRDEFPEVWIWMETYVGSRGLVRIPKITPDSITTWKTNAFAVHPRKGISVLENPIEFLSFQKMFLILNLPYSVIRNERLIINVIVFNYLPTTQKVQVRIRNSGLVYKDYAMKITKVQAKSYEGVKFSIRPKIAWDVPIELDLYVWNGRRFILVDRLIKILKVKPEGRTVYVNEEHQANLTVYKALFLLRIDIPTRYLVPYSERIEICVTGDIMGPVINGLGKLVRLPSGCGEQTAVALVPNIYIYIYLQARKALDAQLRKKLIKFTQSGYQNQLRYQKRDGSYSAYQSARQGSVWLTAFIAKSFQLVSDSGMPVYIDKKRLQLSLKWLLRKQRLAGNFIETGRVLSRAMQGGSSGGRPLTAYVVMALVSMKSLQPNLVSKAIVKAELFLAQLNLHKLDVYTLCILLCTYSKINNIGRFLAVENVLRPKATVVGNMMYWKGKYDIEQTAYALLAYAYMKNIPKGKKILNWLLSKRNSFGGYSNTQNTVVSLDAMTKFSLFLKQTSKATVQINTGNWSYSFNPITAKNMYVVQKKTVPRTARVISLHAMGDGVVYFTVAWQYNVYNEIDDKFGLSVAVNTTLGKSLIIVICFRWTKRTPHEMLVSRVDLPSGFMVQSIGCKDGNCQKYMNCTKSWSCLDKKEIENDKVNLYLKQLPYNRGVYVVINLRRRHSVVNKNTKLYVKTTSYYSGEVSVVPFNPFTHTLPGNIPW